MIAWPPGAAAQQRDAPDERALQRPAARSHVISVLGRRRGGSSAGVTRLYETFGLVISVLVMGVAIYAVPLPGSLILLTAAALGAVMAIIRIRRSKADQCD